MESRGLRVREVKKVTPAAVDEVCKVIARKYDVDITGDDEDSPFEEDDEEEESDDDDEELSDDEDLPGKTDPSAENTPGDQQAADRMDES